MGDAERQANAAQVSALCSRAAVLNKQNATPHPTLSPAEAERANRNQGSEATNHQQNIAAIAAYLFVFDA